MVIDDDDDDDGDDDNDVDDNDDGLVGQRFVTNAALISHWPMTFAFVVIFTLLVVCFYLLYKVTVCTRFLVRVFSVLEAFQSFPFIWKRGCIIVKIYFIILLS